MSILANLSVEEEWCTLLIHLLHGYPSSMSTCQSFVTGVVYYHDEKDCKMWICSKGTLCKDEQKYDAWLRPTIAATAIGDKENAEISVTDANQNIPTNTKILKSHNLFCLHLTEIDHDLNANDEPTESNTAITAGTFNETAENMEPCTITPNAMMVTSLEGTYVLDGPHNGPTDATQPATA
ncbi:hypothetical protein CFP56_024321 [Quercus suber]|uniref:Uncharacterized protein n=1 Tax=Quercus suber TaxID=58331 RepID=A0AAW0MHT9_QUESU